MEKIKLKTKSGKIIRYPVSKIKSIISSAGYSGSVLLKATGGTFNEAKKLAKGGIITMIDLEKAIVRGINNTNNIAIDSVQKITKRILK